MKPNPRKILRPLWALVFIFLVFTSNLFAGSIDSTVIGMFPRETGDIGYADLSVARQLPWYPQFEAQVAPVGLFGFEQLLEAIQMRSTSPIDQVVWASVPDSRNGANAAPGAKLATGNGQRVAVVIGDFDADAIQSYLDSKKIPSIQIGSYNLYSSGTGPGSSNIAFAVLDSHTIAVGPLGSLKRVLRIRDGEEDSLLQNEPMMAAIERANGECIFWGVLNSANAAGTIARLVPEAANFPQSRALIGKLNQVLITVKAPDDIDLEFQAESDSASDAVLLSQLLQAGVLMRRYQTDGGNNPELSKLLDALRIAANGNGLDISLTLTHDQMVSLMEHNTFSIGL